MLDRVGKYELKRVLGKGASGTVYLGVDTFSRAEVAVKVIDPVVFQDAENGHELRAQFLNEASLVGQLHHPHIVSIFDAVVTEDSGHIAMAYVPGGNLLKRTNAQNLFSIEDAIQVGFKCCGALDYAFRQGIVHRDIKPANIMVVRDTEIKISDFGAAYLWKNTQTESMNIGSPAYMSPEQIGGQPLTHQSDMFSVGIVLYELLTAQRPFIAHSLPEMLDKVMNADPLPPSRVRPDLPSALDRIVMTALNKAPAARFSTWAEFALELAKAGGLSFHQQTIRDSEKYEALRRIEMLQKLNDGQIWELVNAGRWMRLPAHSLVIREDELGQNLFFLATGQAKATKRGRTLNLIGAGECFGEMAYIRGGQMPRQATVETLTETVFAEFESAALEQTSVSCQLHFTRALVRTLVERLEFANVRVAKA
ncbi:MAG: serine/threonine-protein kinase [Sulfuritalea sp.]|nr:serine/threonine-protein kinase [Sulfuritalea sp.]